MALCVYPKVTKADTGAFISNLARFLCNDLGGYTGPGWTVVEGYDGAYAGTKRQVPTTPGDLDSFPVGFSWRADAIAVNDWIVLQSLDCAKGTKFMLYIEYQSTTSINFKMFPLADFAAGGADASPPDFSAGMDVPDGATTFSTMTSFSAPQQYSIVADAASVAVLNDGGSNPNFFYAGEATEGRTADTRPFVIRNTNTSTYVNVSSSEWSRLSPADDTTVLTTGKAATIGGYGFGGNAFNVCVETAGDEGFLGEYSILPFGVFFYGSHYVGNLKHVGIVSRSLGAAGTLNGLAWMYRNESFATGYNEGIALEWDSATSYP